MSVFALLAGAPYAPDGRCASDEPARPTSHALEPRGQEPLAVLASLDDARAAVDKAAASARRLISICTPDLEPQLYDQSAFLEIIKRFVLSRSFSKVRVLIAEPARIARDDNRFVAMSRRLSSCIEIRHAAGPSAQPPAAAARPPAAAARACATASRACAAAAQASASYLIADDRAIVHRLRADAWDGIAHFDNPAVARLYLDEFDGLWSRSSAEGSLRKPRLG